MKQKCFYSCILFFLLSLSARSGSFFEFNERVQQGYLQVVRLKFEEGKRILDEEQRVNPSNQLPVLYDAYIDFLRAFISEEKKDFDTFRDHLDVRLKKLKDIDSPFSLYSQAEIMLQDALLRIKFREFVSAAFEIRKVYRMIERNAAIYPAFPLNRKITGFLHVLVGSVPKNYRWLTDLAGMDGTIQYGTEELSGLLKVTEKTQFRVYREEILFYLGIVHNFYSKKENNPVEFINEMKPLCSQSLLVRYCYSNLLVKSGRNDEALEVLTDTASTTGSYPFYFLSYKIGAAKLSKLDFTAEQDFQDFVLHFHGMHYLRSAYQKLAWIYLLRNDKAKYADCIGLCKKNGTDFVDEDKDASKEAGSGEVPNLILLRARLLFDGGYYQRSLAEIAGKSIDYFPRYKDQLEVTYRLARIFHKTNQVDKAIVYYEQTRRNGSSSTYYFAANSTLLLGTIYEERNEMEKAKDYYTKCLALRDHEYQNSIDQKAKAGLERLKVKN